MFDPATESHFPGAGPWNGMTGVINEDYARSEGRDIAASPQTISRIISEVIAAQNGIIDVYTLACKIQNALNVEIEQIKDDLINVSKEKGPKGDQGEKGDSGDQGPKGDAGEQGPQGLKGDAGDTPKIEVKVIDAETISINGVEIKLPRGKDGRSIPVKKGGLGASWVGGGSDRGLQGEPGIQGPPGPPGSGISVLSNEASCDFVIGQPVRILPTTKAALGFDGECIGLAYNNATTGSAVQWLGEGGVISQSDWTSVTGTVTLSPGMDYFLDQDTPGRLTTAPMQNYSYVFKIGKAANTTDLLVEFGTPVKL